MKAVTALIGAKPKRAAIHQSTFERYHCTESVGVAVDWELQRFMTKFSRKVPGIDRSHRLFAAAFGHKIVRTIWTLIAC
jgi:hypothetical protein